MEPPPPETNVYFYPVRGQSPEQQDRDKYECNTWAVQQSGFDPSCAAQLPLRFRAKVQSPTFCWRRSGLQPRCGDYRRIL